jgi:hypothetical protein
MCVSICKRGCSDAEKEDPVPQSGSQTARGLLQAFVSSRNRSSFWTRFGNECHVIVALHRMI